MDPSAGPIIAPTRKVDHIQRVKPEVTQIVVNARRSIPAVKEHGGQDLSAPRRAPTLVTITRPIRIRMERLLDNLIGHVRTVKVAGVDVVHAGRNRLTQHGDRGIQSRGGPHTCGPASCIAP